LELLNEKDMAEGESCLCDCRNSDVH
jgi:hypothetical protein